MNYANMVSAIDRVASPPSPCRIPNDVQYDSLKRGRGKRQPNASCAVCSVYLICEWEDRRAAEKDSWNNLSKRAHLDSRDVFPNHQGTILGISRCQERHETWDGREYLQGYLWMKMGHDIQARGMNEHNKDRRQSILRTDRLAGWNPSLILPIEGATSPDPMLSPFQNEAAT